MSIELTELTESQWRQQAQLGREVHYPDAHEHHAVTYSTRYMTVKLQKFFNYLWLNSQFPSSNTGRRRMDLGLQAFIMGTELVRTLLLWQVKRVNINPAGLKQIETQCETDCTEILTWFNDLPFVYAMGQWGTCFRFFRMRRNGLFERMTGESGTIGFNEYLDLRIHEQRLQIDNQLKLILQEAPFTWMLQAQSASFWLLPPVPSASQSVFKAFKGQDPKLEYINVSKSSHVWIQENSTYVKLEKGIVVAFELGTFLYDEKKNAYYHATDLVSMDYKIWVIRIVPKNYRVFVFPVTGRFLIFNGTGFVEETPQS